MMKIFLVVKLLIWITFCGSQQTFQYQNNDTVQIQPNSTLELSLEIITAADQYLSQNQIIGTLTMQQISNSSYNIIYFLCQQSQGMECFQNWIVYGQTIEPTNCSQINQGVNTQAGCTNYSGCGSELKSIQISLTQQIYKRNAIFIENTSLNETIILNISNTIHLQSSNSWFYWGIGLICYFIISLVIYSGILFKVILKYKNVKKKFQQFKLTQYSQSSIKND